MPKENIDYSKTIIYKIVCKDIDIKDCYVGSTTDFVRRKYVHRNNAVNITPRSHLYVYEFINKNGRWNNWEMIEVEKLNASDKLDALERERFWLEELKATLNKQKPFRTLEEKQEYYQVNKDQLLEKKKIYYENNKEYFKEYQEVHRDKIAETRKKCYENNKEYTSGKITCECGSLICRGNISIHKKSQKHLNFLKEQIE